MNRHQIMFSLALLAGSLLVANTLTAADDPFAVPPSGLTLTAKADVAKAAPGEQIKVEVTIQNETAEKRSFDVPSMWWAKSDQNAIVFPSWPKLGGLGPAIVYQQIDLEPGKSYTRTWTATVGNDAKEGDLEFKIGLALKRLNQDFKWSDPMKVTILPQKPQPATRPVLETTRPAAATPTTVPAVHVVNVRDLMMQ